MSAKELNSDSSPAKPFSRQFIICSIFVIIFGIASALGYSHYEWEIQRTIKANKATANSLARIILEHQRAVDGVIQSYARRPLLIAAAKKRDSHEALKHLARLKGNNSDIDAIFITDPTGNLWIDFPVHKESHGVNFSYRDWYRGVSKEWKPYVSGVYKRFVDPKDVVLAVSSPIFDEGGRPIGILGAVQPAFSFENEIQAIPTDPGVKMTLIDQGGHIIYSNRFPFGKEVTPFPPSPFLDNARREENGEIEFPDPAEGDRVKYAAFAPVGGIGWSVIVEKGRREILAGETEYFILNAIISSLLFSLAVLSMGHFRKKFIIMRMAERQKADETLRQKNEILQKSEQEARRLAGENALMAEIGRIVSSTINIDDVYELFAEEVKKLIPFDRIAINIINPAESTISIPYLTGVDVPPYKKGGIIPLSGTVAERIMRTRSGLIVQAKAEDPDKAEEEIKTLFPSLLSTFRAGLRSIMQTPLISKDQVIAILHIQSLAINAYTERDLEIAQRIGNQIAGAIANAQLFAERKQAEDALKRERDRAQKYLDIAGVVLLAIDVDQKVSLINRKGCQLLGYTEEEIIGKNWFENFLPKRERERVKAVFAKLVAGEDGHGEYFESPTLSKNGEERVVSWRNTVLTDEGGKITATFSSGEDITERKKGEEAIQRSERKYRKLHESMMDGFVFTSMDGMIKEFNESFNEIVGYTPKEILKLTYRDLTPEKWHTFEQKIVEEQILPRGYSEVYEKEYRKKDGTEFPVELRTFLIKDETGNNLGMWAIVRDITERKRVENKIRESLREKEALLKEIHHRVKNNLQVISSLLNWQSRHIQDPSALEMFKESQNRVKSMAIIHERLYQSKDLAKVNFREYLQGLATHLSRSYQTGGKEISLQIDMQEISLGIDRAIPCGMVINELISNSFKHAFSASSQGEISLSLKPNGEGRLILTVKDNGTGLPQNYDFRSAESFGMQLVNILTSQMGGTIELDRQKGTEFRITFPAG